MAWCGARAVFWPEAEACDAVCGLTVHESTVHRDHALGEWDEADLVTVHGEESAMDDLVVWLRSVLDADGKAAGVFRRVSLWTEAEADVDTDEARERYLKMVTPEQALADIAAKRAVLDLWDLARLSPHSESYGALTEAVRAIAGGYRHRPGWNPAWG